MRKIEAKHIEVLPKETVDAQFEQIESGVHHTPYESECAFYACIEYGDTNALVRIMESYMAQNIVVGRMSSNDLKQMQYFAVCCIALATRAAIRGGLSEVTAFNLSDEYIRKVDIIQQPETIPLFLSEKAFELTQLVRDSSHRASYPEIIRKAVYYIETQVYKKLSSKEIAEKCNISKDYLNVLFKRFTGMTTGAYISKVKLEEGKRLLSRGLKVSEIAYQLAYCSESYFIACYKKEFGETPKKQEAVH